MSLARSLAVDSQTSKQYNVLILTKHADQAQTLLRSSLGRLLGPRFCGRWTDWPVEAERAHVVACGTLMPICCKLSEPRMQLEIARADGEWVDGERRLGGYRDEFVV